MGKTKTCKLRSLQKYMLYNIIEGDSDKQGQKIPTTNGFNLEDLHNLPWR